MHARLDAIADLARGIDGMVQSLAQRVQAAEQRSKDAETKDAVRAQIASQTAPLQQRLAAAEHQLEAVNPKAVQAQIASETAPLQQLKQRYPVDARRFHGYGIDATGGQPIR